MTTPNPDRRIGEEKPMNNHQTSEAGQLRRYQVFSTTPNEAVIASEVAVTESPEGVMCYVTDAERIIAHLRAQLAGAERERDSYKEWQERNAARLVAACAIMDELRAASDPALRLLEQLGNANGPTGYDLRVALAKAPGPRDNLPLVEWSALISERDAAQARAGEMEGLLREALPVVRSMAEWCRLNPTDRETRGLTDIADRIDAALATSPHRLAGRE